MNISVVIPLYNEEESILSTISSIEKIRETFPHQLDYLVINDGSIDSTEDILKQIEKRILKNWESLLVICHYNYMETG